MVLNIRPVLAAIREEFPGVRVQWQPSPDAAHPAVWVSFPDHEVMLNLALDLPHLPQSELIDNVLEALREKAP